MSRFQPLGRGATLALLALLASILITASAALAGRVPVIAVRGACEDKDGQFAASNRITFRSENRRYWRFRIGYYQFTPGDDSSDHNNADFGVRSGSHTVFLWRSGDNLRRDGREHKLVDLRRRSPRGVLGTKRDTEVVFLNIFDRFGRDPYCRTRIRV